jgi:hypothetical protein
LTRTDKGASVASYEQFEPPHRTFQDRVDNAATGVEKAQVRFGFVSASFHSILSERTLIVKGFVRQARSGSRVRFCELVLILKHFSGSFWRLRL